MDSVICSKCSKLKLLEEFKLKNNTYNKCCISCIKVEIDKYNKKKEPKQKVTKEPKEKKEKPKKPLYIKLKDRPLTDGMQRCNKCYHDLELNKFTDNNKCCILCIEKQILINKNKIKQKIEK